MDISWTWLGIVVLALIIFACASGFRRGFVKEIVSAFFMIISFLLVWVINPYVNTFVREYNLFIILFRVTARNWSWNRQAARKLWIKKNRRR